MPDLSTILHLGYLIVAVGVGWGIVRFVRNRARNNADDMTRIANEMESEANAMHTETLKAVQESVEAVKTHNERIRQLMAKLK